MEDYHTYFVGTNGFLVHNDCAADMMYAGREAIKKAKSLCIDEDKVLLDTGSDVVDYVKRFKISDPN